MVRGAHAWRCNRLAALLVHVRLCVAPVARRYLEAAFKRLDWDSYLLVDEALSERAYMIDSAPFMAKPIPIMIPVYSWPMVRGNGNDMPPH